MSDKEWALLEPLFFPEGVARKAGRAASRESVRECYNAIRYLLKTGCQWRMLPVEFPPRATVHDALTRWSADGLGATAFSCNETWPSRLCRVAGVRPTRDLTRSG